jgi:hypothetical protein
MFFLQLEPFCPHYTAQLSLQILPAILVQITNENGFENRLEFTI